MFGVRSATWRSVLAGMSSDEPIAAPHGPAATVLAKAGHDRPDLQAGLPRLRGVPHLRGRAAALDQRGELSLPLTLAASDSLPGRGIDPAEPGGDAKVVELVVTRATALAQVIDDLQNRELVERAQGSLELLVASLTEILGERPPLS